MALAFAFAEVANGLADLFRYDLRGDPRYYIFHVIDEIAVQILVVAETVAFSRANGLELVDMDIVPVGWRELVCTTQTCKPGPAVINSRKQSRGPWTVVVGSSSQNSEEPRSSLSRSSGLSQRKLKPCEI